MNVILVSSEHNFPSRLKHPDLGFSLNNLSGYLFAGEVAPKDMYQLLITEWGMTSNLAHAFISIYGGHILDTYQAVVRLEEEKERFWTLDSGMTNSVIKCLSWKGNEGGDDKRMCDALRQLATTGFYPIEYVDDPVARAISQFGVGGVVCRSSDIIGLEPTVWDSTPFENAIIPSKQSMRLAIDKVLHQKNI